MCFYQTLAADWIAGAGVPVAVTAGTRAKIGAAGDAFETGGTRLTGQAGVAGRTSGKSAVECERQEASLLGPSVPVERQ